MKSWPLKFALFLNFLVLAMLLNSVGAVALHVQRSYGVTASAAGTLALCKSIGIGAASFASALCLAAIGYRRAMLIALAALSLVCALVPSLPQIAMLRLLFFVAGASFAVIKISVYASVGLVARDDRDHASLLTLLEAVFPVGIVLGSLLFGAWTDDADPTSVTWLRVFYFLSGASALVALVVASVPIEDKAIRAQSERSLRGRATAAFRLNAVPGVVMFGVCVFLYVMIEQSTLNWLPTFNSQVLHLAPGLSIQLAGSLTLMVCLGRLLAAYVLRRAPWFSVLSGCLCAAAILVLLGLATLPEAAAPVAPGRTIPLAAMIIPAIGFFLAPIYPTLNSAMLRRVATSEHGAISSWAVMVSAAGSSIGTLIAGVLFERYGGRSALQSVLIPMAGLGLGLMWFQQRIRPVPPAVVVGAPS